MGKFKEFDIFVIGTDRGEGRMK